MLHKLFILLIFIQPFNGESQNFNVDVAAKILIRSENDLMTIAGTAINQTEINQSLRYELSVIKNNPLNSNRSTNNQSGRFVLEPGQQKELSTTTIHKNSKDRIILLLLIYNLEDQIIGKDRLVLNDNSDADDIAFKQKLVKKLASEEQDISDSGQDGALLLTGIVIEEVKTKAGRDFYQLFASQYRLDDINAEQIVKIREVILRANTTIINVIVGDKIVHQFLVKTQLDYLKENANISIRQVSKYLIFLTKNRDTLRSY